MAEVVEQSRPGAEEHEADEHEPRVVGAVREREVAGAGGEPWFDVALDVEYARVRCGARGMTAGSVQSSSAATRLRAGRRTPR